MRRFLQFVAILWSVWCVVATGQRVATFQTDYTLWADAVLKAPYKPRPWINYGWELEKLGSPNALDAFTRAEWLFARRPNQHTDILGIAQSGQIRVLTAMGQLEQAEDVARRVDTEGWKSQLMRESYAALQLTAGRCRQMADQQGQILWNCPNTIR